jgi:hypothetical protein
LHAGLAELLAGREEPALKHFKAIVDRGVYSTDPSEQDLANFFIRTAKKGMGREPIKLEAIADLDRTNYEAINFFIFGVRNWSLGAYDDAWQLLRQFSRCTPQDRYVWISDYKPLASPYLVEINAFRGASATAQAAASLETRRRALRIVKNTRENLKLAGHFPARLKKLADDLQQKITAEEEESARLMSATEAADAKALADAETKIAALWQQFRLTEASAVAKAIQTTGEKAQHERAALVKRMEWLAKFKATLINDLNTLGYPSPVMKKTGGNLPGPIRRANEMQIESVTPFGSLPALWIDLPPDSILAMARSYFRPEFPPETLADRQWLLGVYAMQVGRPGDGRELLTQASKVRENYRADLPLFLEDATEK